MIAAFSGHFTNGLSPAVRHHRLMVERGTVQIDRFHIEWGRRFWVIDIIREIDP